MVGKGGVCPALVAADSICLDEAGVNALGVGKSIWEQ